MLQQPHLLRRAVIGLGAGMQGNRRQIKFQQAKILHYQRIRSRLIELVGQPLGCLELLILQDGIEGHIDPGAKAVGKMAQRLNLGQGIARGSARTKTGATDIDSIGAVTDRLHTKLAIFGRSQQLKRMGGGTRRRRSRRLGHGAPSQADIAGTLNELEKRQRVYQLASTPLLIRQGVLLNWQNAIAENIE